MAHPFVGLLRRVHRRPYRVTWHTVADAMVVEFFVVTRRWRRGAEAVVGRHAAARAAVCRAHRRRPRRRRRRLAAQAQIDFRRTEGSRVLAAAENLAARAVLRQALEAPAPRSRVSSPPPSPTRVQSLSGASFVRSSDADGGSSRTRATPADRAAAVAPHGDRRRRGPAAWVGDGPGAGGARGRGARARCSASRRADRAARRRGRGRAAVPEPRREPALRGAEPAHLPRAGRHRSGSPARCSLARRVKRQTLGLEPREIRGLVEHREAMLTGIKEGVLGPRPRRPRDAGQRRGAPDAAAARRVHRADAGTSSASRTALRRRPHRQRRAADAVVFAGERILTLNRKPVAVRGTAVGSVTTMRDLTELRAAAAGAGRHPADDRGAAGPGARVRQPAAHDLRAAGARRSTTRCCATSSGSARRPRSWRRRSPSASTSPPLAALLIAKSSVAAERGDPAAPRAETRASGRSTTSWRRTSPPSSATSSTTRWTRSARSAAARWRSRCVEDDGERARSRSATPGPGWRPSWSRRCSPAGSPPRPPRGGYRGLRAGADPHDLRAARRLGERAQRRRGGVRRAPAARPASAAVPSARRGGVRDDPGARRRRRLHGRQGARGVRRPHPRRSRSSGWRTPARTALAAVAAAAARPRAARHPPARHVRHRGAAPAARAATRTSTCW